MARTVSGGSGGSAVRSGACQHYSMGGPSSQMADLSVTLRINADGTAAVQGIDKVASASQRMGGTSSNPAAWRRPGSGWPAPQPWIWRARSIGRDHR